MIAYSSPGGYRDNMKEMRIVLGVMVVASIFLLTGKLAYAGALDGFANQYGFSGSQLQSQSSGGYTYNPAHGGINATYVNAQGSTLTIAYCDNGAYVVTVDTVCSSAPNQCGMVGSGFSSSVYSAEPQVQSRSASCTAQTPSNSFCNGSNPPTTLPNTRTNASPRAAVLPFWIFDPGYSCPSGQFYENGGCVSSCDIGYTSYDDVSCVFSGCPSGYRLDYSQYQCILIPAQCPSGYVSLGNNICRPASCTPAYSCQQDGNLYYTNAKCQQTLSQICSWGCAAGACLPAPSGNITAIPLIVKSGETTNISWQGTNVQSCTISGSNGNSWSCTGQACSATTTKSSSAILGQTIYSLRCLGPKNMQISKSVTVDIVPNFREQ